MGGFEFSVLQRNLKEFARKAMEMCFRVLKESNKNRFDSYSRQAQFIDHIPYYLSGLSHALFFQQPFSKQLYTIRPCEKKSKIICALCLFCRKPQVGGGGVRNAGLSTNTQVWQFKTLTLLLFQDFFVFEDKNPEMHALFRTKDKMHAVFI